MIHRQKLTAAGSIVNPPADGPVNLMQRKGACGSIYAFLLIEGTCSELLVFVSIRLECIDGMKVTKKTSYDHRRSYGRAISADRSYGAQRITTRGDGALFLARN